MTPLTWLIILCTVFLCTVFTVAGYVLWVLEPWPALRLLLTFLAIVGFALREPHRSAGTPPGPKGIRLRATRVEIETETI